MKEKEENDVVKDNNSIQFLNQIIKPQAVANEKNKIDMAKKLVLDIENNKDKGTKQYEFNAIGNAYNEVLLTPV